MAKDTATVWVEEFIANPALSEGHRALIREFMAQPAGEGLSGEEVLGFVLEWVRELHGPGDSATIDAATLATLKGAHLPWDLAVTEGLLRRLAEDPKEAVRYITEKVEELSARNTQIARRGRPSRRDLWSDLIDDCLDDNPDAIERALSHNERDRVRAAYHRGPHWKERVEMAQWWSDYLDQLRKGADIVSFPERAASA